jgi:hypothetical protein
MMTKLKLPANKHILLIISCIIIAIGMAVGTVCHFIFGGFFNYGSEFSDYNSINVTYLAAEYSEKEIKSICDETLADLNTVDVSVAEVSVGGELVYKFSANTDTDKLQAATDALNAKLSANDGLSTASLVKATTYVGGLRSLNYAFIALASTVAFACLYFIFRYRFAAAITSILSNVFCLGLYIALLAITRIPVGIEAVAFGCVAVLLSLIISGLFCNKAHKNIKNPDADINSAEDVVNSAYGYSVKLGSIVVCFTVIAVAVLAIFAICAFLAPSILSPFAIAILALVSVAYTGLCFMPCVYSIFKGIFDNMKNKDNKKADK